MKKVILVLFALFVLAASAAQADTAATGGNFVSGNKNNDGHYTPRKVRSAVKDPNRAPGFWDKEWERSGLNRTVGGAWWSPMGKTGDFFKKKDEEYRAKHPAADVK